MSPYEWLQNQFSWISRENDMYVPLKLLRQKSSVKEIVRKQGNHTTYEFTRLGFKFIEFAYEEYF